MPVRPIPLLLVLFAVLLGACSRETPEAALERSARELQQALEAKDVGGVLDLLHPQFQGANGLDRQAAEQRLRLILLRHRQIRIYALHHESRLDSSYADRGRTEAEVAVSGAEGLLPERAGHYRVRLEWWREGDDWRLARLDWD